MKPVRRLSIAQGDELLNDRQRPPSPGGHWRCRSPATMRHKTTGTMPPTCHYACQRRGPTARQTWLRQATTVRWSDSVWAVRFRARRRTYRRGRTCQNAKHAVSIPLSRRLLALLRAGGSRGADDPARRYSFDPCTPLKSGCHVDTGVICALASCTTWIAARSRGHYRTASDGARY